MGHIHAIEFLVENSDPYSTYAFNPNNFFRRANWNLYHTFLGDLRCIDPNEIQNFLDDQLYNYNNKNFMVNFNNFIDYCFNQSKNIYSYAANYKNLPDSLKVTNIINYLFLENLTNENLINLIINSNYFFLIYNETSIWLNYKYTIYLFQANISMNL
ncbi:MAG: hypothetical protein ACTSRH_06200 [Promethearchaeota archaeon]